MRRLVCTKDVKHGMMGSYKAGAVIDVTDDHADRLLRACPGFFAVTPDQPEPEEQLSAMSTETETGIVAPDRRARGGKKRAGRSRRQRA